MFGKRDAETSPRKFWTWFAAEAQGLTNALEALSRGEADAEWALSGLNDRIRRLDSTLSADVVRMLDGHCHMTVAGADHAVDALLAASPGIHGWTFSSTAEMASRPRVPFRLAPRPSMDRLTQPITGLYEAYA